MQIKTMLKSICLVAIYILPEIIFAAGTDGDKTLGGIASNITESLSSFTTLIIGIATVAGLGFGVAAIFKFKQHRDNPQQVTLGQPLSLLAIAVMLLWLPYLLQSAGGTLAGKDAQSGQSKIGETPAWLQQDN